MTCAVQSGVLGISIVWASALGLVGLAAAQDIEASGDDATSEQEAEAASPPEASDVEARAHFQAAADAFQIADYAAARREYERAFELSGRPEVMYQLYLCDERLGDLDGAIGWLERYLLEASDVPRRETLVARLATMRERAARGSEPEVPPETIEAETPPLPERLVEAPAVGTAPSDAVVRRSSAGDEGLLTGGITMLVAAALGFAASGVTGAFGVREQDRLARECVFGVCEAELRSVQDEARGLFLAADALWIGSLAVAAAGAVFTVLGLTLEQESTP